MRKTILLLASILALTTGCHRAEDISPEAPVFREIAVNIGENGDGTRSLVSIEAENFREASLFAFDASSNEVLTYPEHAGDLEGSKPVAIHTTQKTFNWALPIGRALDIYVIVNYGTELGNTLNSYLTNPNLTKSTLNALKFTAMDNVYMTDIEAAGIPMSGVVHTTLANENSPLNVTVKRLYARYNLWFDLSDLEAHNATLQALHIVTENVNTEIPFFQEGFKQTDRSKFKQYDRATSTDLDLIQQGGNGHQITLYVPENCQGDISGASDWKSVAGLGSKVLNCSYVDMDVKIIDQDGLWKDYHVYLYLGTDYKSNFDVHRNYNTTVGIKIPYAPAENPSLDFFYWDSHELVTVAPGQEVTLDYVTNLSSSDININCSYYDTGVSAGNAIEVKSKGADKVILKAAASLTDGTKFIVTGGNADKSAQDTKPLQIVVSSVVLEDMEVLCYVESVSEIIEEGPGHLRMYEGTGNDINVYVDKNDGNDVWVRLGCRAKYNGAWHDVLPGDELVQYRVTGLIGPTSTRWVSPTGTGWTWQSSYMPGDVDVIEYLFNDEVVRTFRLYYVD